jgi:hypothetical protein
MTAAAAVPPIGLQISVLPGSAVAATVAPSVAAGGITVDLSAVPAVAKGSTQAIALQLSIAQSSTAAAAIQPIGVQLDVTAARSSALTGVPSLAVGLAPATAAAVDQAPSLQLTLATSAARAAIQAPAVASGSLVDLSASPAIAKAMTAVLGGLSFSLVPASTYASCVDPEADKTNIHEVYDTEMFFRLRAAGEYGGLAD